MNEYGVWHAVLGITGIIMLCYALIEIRTIALKNIKVKRPWFLGWAMALFFLTEPLVIYDKLETFPKWAMVLSLVGIGFGASAGLVVAKGSQGQKIRET
jgi:hypothetical protein